MARVVPVGLIDPELYAFAKKEAEKAERNPRYVPKNCPTDMCRIIYKRIGATVKALVVPTIELIGMHWTNFTNTYVPYKKSLYDSNEHSEFWGRNTFYDLWQSVYGIVPAIGRRAISSITVRFVDKYLDEAESCKTIVEPESDDPPPHYNTKKAICLRDKLKIKVVHELTIDSLAVDFHPHTSHVLWCGRKDDKFLVLYLKTYTHTEMTYTLVVNGVERLSKTQELYYQYALAVRIDDGGLAYIINAEIDVLTDSGWRYWWSALVNLRSADSAYGAISNKYGVFVVVRESKGKERRDQHGHEYTSTLYFYRIVWIRPKEKYAEDEDAIHILDNDNSEIIVITPLEPPKFGEKDGADYPEGDEPSWEYPYMLFATTADKNAVIASYDDSIFDVTPIIKRYIASKGTDDEMTADDVGKWRGKAIKVGENGQANMPDVPGSDPNIRYMKPGLMHRQARDLIDALYFPPDNP